MHFQLSNNTACEKLALQQVLLEYYAKLCLSFLPKLLVFGTINLLCMQPDPPKRALPGTLIQGG